MELCQWRHIPICFWLTNICEGSCNSRVSNSMRDVSVIMKGEGLRESQTVIVGLLKSTTWMSVCCECCVLPGRGLCDGPIHRPGEAFRMFAIDRDQEH